MFVFEVSKFYLFKLSQPNTKFGLFEAKEIVNWDHFKGSSPLELYFRLFVVCEMTNVAKWFPLDYYDHPPSVAAENSTDPDAKIGLK